MELPTDVQSAQLIAKGIATIAIFGTAIGQGIIGGKAMEAMGRNPEVSGQIFTRMIIAMALAETGAIYSLVAFFLL